MVEKGAVVVKEVYNIAIGVGYRESVLKLIKRNSFS